MCTHANERKVNIRVCTQNNEYKTAYVDNSASEIQHDNL